MTSAVRRSQTDLIATNEGENSIEVAAQTPAENNVSGSSSSNNDANGCNNTRKSDQSLGINHESEPSSPIQVSSVASCPEIRNPSPCSSPQPSPKMQPKFTDKRQSSPSSTSSVSREVSAEKLAELDAYMYVPNEDNISRSSESTKSTDFQRSGELCSAKEICKDKKGSDKKKKSSSWYNVLNPTYKSRSDDFKRLFKDLPENERLVVDYSCALQKDILVHGRLYISQNYICFYANIFRWETTLILQCKDVTGMTKEKTARVIPNAIQICTDKEKHFFTSFGTRDKTYLMLFRVWQNALMEQPMSIQEMWQWVHYSYGDELGLTSDDDDYVDPYAEDDTKNNNGLLAMQDSKELLKALPLKSPLAELCPDMIKALKESPTGLAEGQGILNGCGRENISDVPDTSLDKSQPDKLPLSLSKIGSLVDPGLPTDLSDTTESDNEMPREVFCPCEAHFGKEVINIVYPMTVEQIFKLLFTESKFYLDFLHSRKTSDISHMKWEPQGETSNKIRQVTYTLTLNLSMGPKTAQTTETQTILNVSKAGSLYIIDVDAVNTGIPYSDNFYTSHRYCITQVSPTECRLRVHSQIKYRKSVWTVVKTFIEKNVMQGVEEYLRDLEMALHKECVRSKQQIHTKKGLKRRRPGKSNICNPEMTLTDGKALHGHSTVRRISTGGQMEFSRFVGNPDILIKIMLCVLIGLLFLNALLYYKLWSLETQASKMVLPPNLLDLEILRNNPRSHEEWAKLVQHQETLHQVELQKWTEILQSAVELLQQTEDSLNSLQKNIRPYQLQRVLQLFSNPSSNAPEDS